MGTLQLNGRRIYFRRGNAKQVTYNILINIETLEH